MATTRFADHILTGTTAARPAASAVPVGTLYSSSSDGTVYQSSGSAWGTWLAAAPAAGIPVGIVDAKGDLIAASAADTVARLPIGSDGQILTADSTQTVGIKWSAAPSGGIPATIVDAKGDLIAASAADTVARLPVGSDGQILTADSAQTVGVKWAAAAAGGAGGGHIPAVRTGTTANRWYAPGESGGTVGGAEGPVPVGHIRVMPFVPPKNLTVNAIAVNNTNPVAGNLRIGIWADDGNVYPAALLADSGNINSNTGGVQTYTVSQALTAGTVYWFGYLCSSAISLRGIVAQSMLPILGHTSTLGAGGSYGWDATFAFAALPNPFPAGAATIDVGPVGSVYVRFA